MLKNINGLRKENQNLRRTPFHIHCDGKNIERRGRSGDTMVRGEEELESHTLSERKTGPLLRGLSKR